MVERGLESPEVRAAMVASVAALEPYVAAWRALARRACEANVYQEPEFLLPCLEELGPHLSVRVVLVFKREPAAGEEVLIGLFAFCRARMHKLARLPELKGLSIQWLRHHLLGTPLIHEDHAAAAVDGFLDFIDRRPEGLGLAELRECGVDGAVWRELRSRLADRGQPHLQGGRVRSRALFCRRASAGEFFDATIGKKSRRARLDQQRRQLMRLGELAYRRLEPGDDHEPWVRSFLELEVVRWEKHADGKPLAADAAERRFFEKAARLLHEDGRLLMHGLTLNGRMIAQNCTLLAGNRSTAFVFRIAYDEHYAKHSPGVQLELDIIRAYHEPDSAITRVDSCAHPAHRLWNPLWADRQHVSQLLIGASHPSTRLLLNGMTAVQRASKAAAPLRSSVESFLWRHRGSAVDAVPKTSSSFLP